MAAGADDTWRIALAGDSYGAALGTKTWCTMSPISMDRDEPSGAVFAALCVDRPSLERFELFNFSSIESVDAKPQLVPKFLPVIRFAVFGFTVVRLEIVWFADIRQQIIGSTGFTYRSYRSFADCSPRTIPGLVGCSGLVGCTGPVGSRPLHSAG